MKHLKAIICAAILLAGALFVVVDGAIELFGAPRNIQYAVNAVFFLIVLPACIGIGEFDKMLHPELRRK